MKKIIVCATKLYKNIVLSPPIVKIMLKYNRFILIMTLFLTVNADIAQLNETNVKICTPLSMLRAGTTINVNGSYARQNQNLFVSLTIVLDTHARQCSNTFGIALDLFVSLITVSF